MRKLLIKLLRYLLGENGYVEAITENTPAEYLPEGFVVPSQLGMQGMIESELENGLHTVNKAYLEGTADYIDKIRLLFGKIEVVTNVFIDKFGAHDNFLVKEFFESQLRVANRVMRIDSERKKWSTKQQIAASGPMSFGETYKAFFASNNPAKKAIKQVVSETQLPTPHFEELKPNQVKKLFKP